MVKSIIRNGCLSQPKGPTLKTPKNKRTGIHTFSDYAPKNTGTQYNYLFGARPKIGEQIREGKVTEVHTAKITNCWRQTRFPELCISAIVFLISAIFVSLFSNGSLSTLQCTGGIIGFVIAMLVMLLALANLIRHVLLNRYAKKPKPLCPNGMDHVRVYLS